MFDAYRAQFDVFASENFSVFGENSLLLEACRYALLSGGKRFRPSLVLMIADALPFHADARFSALGIECLHTASLVVDDLPSMDNDDERRDMPSVHKKYGEGMALLVSYALISIGYECIAKNVTIIKNSNLSFSKDADLIGMLSFENTAFNTGLRGATGGQFLDLAPPDLSMTTLRDIVQKKTTSLFEIAFVFGWLFGGGDREKLDDVKLAASHFGLAFQIADDFLDVDQDIKNQRSVNFATVFGKKEAAKVFQEEVDLCLSKLEKLSLEKTFLFSFVKGLEVVC